MRLVSAAAVAFSRKVAVDLEFLRRLKKLIRDAGIDPERVEAKPLKEGLMRVWQENPRRSIRIGLTGVHLHAMPDSDSNVIHLSPPLPQGDNAF